MGEPSCAPRPHTSGISTGTGRGAQSPHMSCGPSNGRDSRGSAGERAGLVLRSTSSALAAAWGETASAAQRYWYLLAESRRSAVVSGLVQMQRDSGGAV